MSDKIQLIAHIHPFAPQSRIEAEIDSGKSIAEIVVGLNIKAPNVLAFVNGTRVERNQWSSSRPVAGDHLLVRAVPAGGSNTETAGIGKMVGGAAMAMLGAVLIATGIGAGLGGWLMFSGIGMFVGGALTHMGLFGNLYDGLSSSATASIPALRGGSNQIPQQGTKIPVVFGKHLVVPYYGAKPYTEIGGTDGDIQYLHQLFCVGSGPLRVSQIKIGENIMATNDAAVRNGALTIDGNYSDVEAQIYQNGTNPSLYPACVLEDQPGIELAYGVENWKTAAKRADKVSVDITFPGGLYEYNSKGEKKSRTVEVEVRRRVAGSDTAWSSCTLIGTFSTTRAKSKTMRFTMEGTGLSTTTQWEIGMKRLTADDGDDFSGTTICQWSAFRSHRTTEAPVDATVRGDYVFLALKIKATKQLNGVVDKLNVVAESEYPIYSGSGSGSIAWADGFSSNPAAAFLWALRGPLNPRPISDSDIDWARLEEWSAYCTTKGWTCNAVVSSSAMLKDVLNNIASTGRARLTLRDGLYSVVVDKPRTAVVQHFTPRNVRNFTWTKAFDDLPLGLRVSFVSEPDGWDRNERVVPYPEYTESEAEANLTQATLWGITDPTLISKHALYQLAVAKLRPEALSFEVDPEGLVCEVGDLVVVAHDAILVGLHSGRVKGVYTNEAGSATGVLVDELVTMETGKSYGARFWLASGSSVYAAVTIYVGEGAEFHFDTPIGAASAPADGDLFTFGEAGIETARCIVAGYEMTDDFGVKIYVVDEADDVHTADEGTIPEFDSKVSRPPQNETVETDISEAMAEVLDVALSAATISGEPGALPSDIASLAATAGENSVVLSVGILAGTNVRTSAASLILQRSKDSGATWHDTAGTLDGTAMVPATDRYAWAFSRASDGYPEAAAFSTWRFRAKAVNASGVASLNWTTASIIDVSSYGTWTPAKILAIDGSTAQRTARIEWPNATVYGLTRYEVQIRQYVGGVAGDWYAPGCPTDQTIYDEETNYRIGSVGAVRAVSVSQYTQALPLVGQGLGLASDTAYDYRVRTVSTRPWSAGAIAGCAETTDHLTAGPWSDPVSVLAKATGVYDLVNNAVTSAKIANGAVLEDKIAAGAVTALKIYVEELSAIAANLGVVTAGKLRSPDYETADSGLEIDLDFATMQSKNGKWKIDGTTGKITAFDLIAYGLEFEEVDGGDYSATAPEEGYGYATSPSGGILDGEDYEDGSFSPSISNDGGEFMGG